MPHKATRRDPAMDIIRIFALFCVISVHFFYNNQFYHTPVAGMRMYLMVVIRNFFMISVPLFLILSGYLMGEKRPSAAYFRGIGKTLLTYVLAALVCIGYRIGKQGAVYSLPMAILAITDFSGAQYSWYVEMYIGLYLMIPFLNILYDELENKKQKQTLLAVFLFLSSAPSIINIFRFSDPGWFAEPTRSAEYHRLVPDWWTNIYPITYYFIGRYLREFPLKMPRWKHILSILLVALATGIFNIYRSHDAKFVWGIWQGWYAIPNILQAVLVFDLLAHAKWNIRRPGTLKILKNLSDWTFGAYLVSWIFDQQAYPKLIQGVPEMPQRLEYYLLVVPWVFVCSLVLSALLSLIARLLRRIPQLLKRKVTV